MFFYMYIAPGRCRQHTGDKILMTTERPFLFAHMLQVSKWSLSKSDFIHIFNDFIYVNNHLGTNFWCQQKVLITLPIHWKFKKRKSDFIHILNILYIYSPGPRADNPLGTNFWCQQKALITLPICCRFKIYCFEVRFFINFFHVSPGVYSPG